MNKLYPLKFVPILKEVVWGGSSLVKKYGKQVPVDEETKTPVVNINKIGESWELVDMDNETSAVANGFLAENTLADLIETYMGNLVGDNIFDFYNLQFPLLVKMLDIRENLSVQVHPNDEVAFERYFSLGKNELWYVMEADKEAKVYMGFNRDVSASEFYQRCKDETVEEVLNVYHPQKGECFYIEAGTVHAAGGGLIIAEIQDASLLTYRLYDWGREHNPKTARTMHLEEAIDCIDYKKYDDAKYHHTNLSATQTIVESRHFTVNNIALKESYKVSTDNFNSFIFYFCSQGSALFQLPQNSDKEEYDIKVGESMMIPASLDELIIVPKQEGTTLLEVHIPKIEEPSDEYIDDSVPAQLDDDKDTEKE